MTYKRVIKRNEEKSFKLILHFGKLLCKFVGDQAQTLGNKEALAATCAVYSHQEDINH